MGTDINAIKQLPQYAQDLHKKYFDNIPQITPLLRLQLLYGVNIEDPDEECPFK